MANELVGLEPSADAGRMVVHRETERTMLDRLRIRYGKTLHNGDWEGRQFIIAEKVPLDPGAWTGTRIADAIVADTRSTAFDKLTPAEQAYGQYGKTSQWGKRQSIHGFEVKVSRSDWLTELADPTKAEAWAKHCHYFWLVASSKDIVRDDLPDGWGLLLPSGNSLRAAQQPTRRDPEPMPTPTVTSLLRAVQRTEVNIAALAATERTNP